MSPRFEWSRRASLALFGAIFFFVLLSTSRERPWADATLIWQVAESIVQRGAIDVSLAWPPNLPPGPDGKTYAVAPLLQALVQVPAAALRRATTAIWPASHELSWRLLSHLAPAALGALTCLLFFAILRREGLSRRASLLATAGLALGTTIWVYARSPYSEILQAACFTGFFGQVLEARRRPDRGAALWLGAWAGLAVNAKIVYAASIPGAALFLAYHLRDRRRELVRLFAWAALAMVPLALMILLYNHARWGSFLHAGYDTKGAATQERVIWGLWGLFASPGKSLLLYSPPLVLSLVALPRALARWPRLLAGLALAVGPVVLLNASLLYWSGDYAWGPRYLVFAVPALLLPAALVIEDALVCVRRRLALAGVAAALGAGLFVQLLGNAFFWDHYIKIQREARVRWLGKPDTRGTPFPDFGGVCGACFEDMHAMIWLPPFQPIEGHFWLLKHAPFRHDWTRAEADAPWRRYTTLQLNVSATYSPVRVDWWFLDYGLDHRAIGITLLALMILGALGPLWWLRIELRRRE